jgi:hypothetical protein
MDATASSFSTRSNAKRAAEQMIAKGTAPAVDYGIKPSNGRFEVVWKTALTAAEFAETAEAQANQASKAEGVAAVFGQSSRPPVLQYAIASWCGA